LHEAVDGGHAELCKLLMSVGASLKLKDDAGMTPLELARELKNPHVVDVLSHVQSRRKRAVKQVPILAEDKLVQTPNRGRGLPPLLGEDRHPVGELIDL
jgi:ankyrin repeat protein